MMEELTSLTMILRTVSTADGMDDTMGWFLSFEEKEEGEMCPKFWLNAKPTPPQKNSNQEYDIQQNYT